MASFNCFAVIAFAFDFFYFGFGVLCLGLVLLSFVRRYFFALPFNFGKLFLFFGFNGLLASSFRFQFVIFAFGDFPFSFRLLSFTKSFVRFFEGEVCLRARFNYDFVRRIGNFVQRRAINSMATARFSNYGSNVVFSARVIVILMALFRSARSEGNARIIQFVRLCSLRAALRHFILFRMLLVFIRNYYSSKAWFSADWNEF